MSTDDLEELKQAADAMWAELWEAQRVQRTPDVPAVDDPVEHVLSNVYNSMCALTDALTEHKRTACTSQELEANTQAIHERYSLNGLRVRGIYEECKDSVRLLQQQLKEAKRIEQLLRNVMYYEGAGLGF